MINILLIILGLGLIIIIHELGHFIVARRNGVRAEAFSVGFGPIIWKKQVGETEYRLSLIPLGGYVKLAGEISTAESIPEPYMLSAKSKWVKLKIFSAGAIMNLILAIPLSCMSFLAGRNVQDATITEPSFFEASAGIKPGDIITKVGNSPVRHANEYVMLMLAHEKGKEIPVTVKRNGSDLTFKVENHWDRIKGFKASNEIFEVMPNSIGEKLGLKHGDVIANINSIRVFTTTQISKILDQNIGKEVEITVQRENKTLTNKFIVPGKSTYIVKPDYHIVQPAIGFVLPNGASNGKLTASDVITEIDGKPVTCFFDMKEALKNKGGTTIDVKVKREDKTEKVTISTSMTEDGHGLLDIQTKSTPYIAHIEEDSVLKNLKCIDHENCSGVQNGDKVTQFDKYVDEVPTLNIAGIFQDNSPKRLQIIRSGTIHTFLLAPQQTDVVNYEEIGFIENPNVAIYLNSRLLKYSLIESTLMSFKEPVDMFIFTLVSFKKLISAEVGKEQLSGPLGIISIIHKSAESGIGNYLFVLVLITINLGILNLLPVPVLDGGHILFLVIEAIRGKPLKEKTVYALLYAGLILLLALVVMATYNDITRFFGT
ncbi:MAG: RIP metalloprotease RseP [Planctomycetes bacterium]|nr:RIP metalloprotease RseP [Planctomycetota bacterium]